MAKLLSHAEYCSAEGDADTPLWGDGQSFDQVACAPVCSRARVHYDFVVREHMHPRLEVWFCRMDDIGKVCAARVERKPRNVPHGNSMAASGCDRKCA